MHAAIAFWEGGEGIDNPVESVSTAEPLSVLWHDDKLAEPHLVRKYGYISLSLLPQPWFLTHPFPLCLQHHLANVRQHVHYRWLLHLHWRMD